MTIKGGRTKKLAKMEITTFLSFVISFISLLEMPNIQLKLYVYKYAIYDKYNNPHCLNFKLLLSFLMKGLFIKCSLVLAFQYF